MARLVAFIFNIYCRPGEARQLLRRHLLPPTRRTGPLQFWIVNLAPQVEGRDLVQGITKTGTVDEAIIVDDVAFMPHMLESLTCGLQPDQKVFDLTDLQTISMFRQATDALRLPRLCCGRWTSTPQRRSRVPGDTPSSSTH